MTTGESFTKLTESGWYCTQLDCSGGDVLTGRRARWTGPSTGTLSYGDQRDKYCGTCKREAKSLLSDCPWCGEHSVRAKSLYEGGGVVCTTEGCAYWFCY